MGYGVLTPQLGIYLAAWAAFHLAEFWVTAVWNGGKLSVDGEWGRVLLSTLCQRSRGVL